MENRILFGLLMLGEGSLALNYCIFCFAAFLGALQFVAANYKLHRMLLLPPRYSKLLGITATASAFLWFFSIQPDLLIPGLAGGELSTFALVGFAGALLVSLGLGVVSMRVLRRRVGSSVRREKIHFKPKGSAEWWLPKGDASSVVLGLSESAIDGMDNLAARLCSKGVAVLVANVRRADAAMQYLDQDNRYSGLPRSMIGVGWGADFICGIPRSKGVEYKHRVAISPYCEAKWRQSGLQWLTEADYISALQLTFNPPVAGGALTAPTLVFCGELDNHVPPTVVSAAFPGAYVVPGARRYGLAGNPIVVERIVAALRLDQPHTIGAVTPVSRSISIYQS